MNPIWMNLIELRSLQVGPQKTVTVSAMNEAAGHHLRDVGKILLQAQSDLRYIRESLTETNMLDDAPRKTTESLQHVVEKVEADLWLKAETVLSAVASASVGTLPTLSGRSSTDMRTYPWNGSLEGKTFSQITHRERRSPSCESKEAMSRPAPSSMATERPGFATLNPMSANHRRRMAERFGIPASVEHPSQRPLGRDKPGLLRKVSKTFSHLRLCSMPAYVCLSGALHAPCSHCRSCYIVSGACLQANGRSNW